MRVAELLVHPSMTPFLSAAVLIVGLVLLEIVLMQFGGSDSGGSEGELDADADFDLDLDSDMDFGGDIDADFAPSPENVASLLEGLDGSGGGMEAESAPPAGAHGSTGPIVGFTGFGRVPLTFWLASLAAGFALSGYVLQLAVAKITGAPLGPWLASALAAIPALWIGGRFSALFARAVPRNETSAISRRSYGRRRGVITVGTARRGAPAQARFSDAHGNLHYVMVEPFDPKDAIAAGTEVLILRRRQGEFVAVPISDGPA